MIYFKNKARLYCKLRRQEAFYAAMIWTRGVKYAIGAAKRNQEWKASGRKSLYNRKGESI